MRLYPDRFIRLIVIITVILACGMIDLAEAQQMSGNTGRKVLGGSTRTPAGPVAPSAAKSADWGIPLEDSHRDWTIMVYLDGDNDLESFALRDLNEMEAGLPDKGVEVIVLMDRAKGYSDAFHDWTTARVYRVRPDRNSDRIASEMLFDAGELNMGDPATVTTFVSQAIKTFPANRYALIFWDHGGGWLHLAMDHDAPGAPEGHDGLTIPEVGRALRQVLQETKIDRLDLIGFDMCLMAQMETAYEISDLGRVMVASQATEPGDGWPYNEILPAFGQGELGARRIGSMVVDAYGRYYEERREQIATLSALDLETIPAVVKALNGFSSKMLKTVPKDWSEMSRAIFYSESYSDRTDLRSGAGSLSSVDLLDLAKRIRHAIPKFPAQTQFAALVDAMDKTVVANYASPRHRLSRGLAIYAPVTSGQFNPAYAETRLAEASGWSNLLSRLYETQNKNLTTPKITKIRVVDAATGQVVKGGKSGGGFRVEAVVEGKNVLWVHSLHALPDKKNNGLAILLKSYVPDPEYYKKKETAVADVIDLIMPDFKGNKNTVSEEFIGKHLSVTNGEIAARATLDASNLEDLRHPFVPVLIKRQGIKQHFARVFFDAITWRAVTVIGEIPQPDGDVVLRQIEPQPDDEITLLFEFIPNGESDLEYLQGDTMAWKDGLELIIDIDDPGDIIVAMRAESIGGRSAYAATKVTIEPYTAEEKGFIENAKKVQLKDLVGTWQWHGIVNGEWQPIPPYTEIKPSEADPEILVAKIYNPKDPDWKVYPNIVLLDTRLMPTLRLLQVDENGEPVEAMNFTMLVSRWENNAPRMILKYLVPKGWLLLWAKKQNGSTSSLAPTATAPQATQPAPTPAPAPQPSPMPPPQTPGPNGLIGAWIHAETGIAVGFDQQQYVLYEGGVLSDQGRYEVRGDLMITVSSMTGETDYIQFELPDPNTLIVKDQDGMVLYFTRAQ